jgi:hypothetical protein
MDNSYLLDAAISHPGLVFLLILGGSPLIARVVRNTLAPVKGLFSRHCYHDILRKRITGSRLRDMLDRRNIDLQYYLYSQPASDIETHIHTCKRCDSLDQCDAYLANENMDSLTSLPFCQINDPLLKIRQQQDNLYKLRNIAGVKTPSPAD